MTTRATAARAGSRCPFAPNGRGSDVHPRSRPRAHSRRGWPGEPGRGVTPRPGADRRDVAALRRTGRRTAGDGDRRRGTAPHADAGRPRGRPDDRGSRRRTARQAPGSVWVLPPDSRRAVQGRRHGTHGRGKNGSRRTPGELAGEPARHRCRRAEDAGSRRPEPRVRRRRRDFACAGRCGWAASRRTGRPRALVDLAVGGVHEGRAGPHTRQSRLTTAHRRVRRRPSRSRPSPPPAKREPRGAGAARDRFRSADSTVSAGASRSPSSRWLCRSRSSGFWQPP